MKHVLCAYAIKDLLDDVEAQKNIDFITETHVLLATLIFTY